MKKEYDFSKGVRGKFFIGEEESDFGEFVQGGVLKPKMSHEPEDTALTGKYDVRDNREEFRKRRELGETCRVCGSKDVHSTQYNRPTMDCIEYLRKEAAEAEEALIDFKLSLEAKDALKEYEATETKSS